MRVLASPTGSVGIIPSATPRKTRHAMTFEKPTYSMVRMKCWLSGTKGLMKKRSVKNSMIDLDEPSDYVCGEGSRRGSQVVQLP